MQKKFNVDFSSIVGGSSSVSEQPAFRPQPVQKTAKPAMDLSGIVLPIPIEESNDWYFQDLSNCSGEEFCSWMNVVYPMTFTEKDYQDCQQFSARIDLFKRVVNFYRNFHISGSRKLKDPPVA